MLTQKIIMELQLFHETRPNGIRTSGQAFGIRCPAGQARLVVKNGRSIPGYKLDVQNIIAVVGPDFRQNGVNNSFEWDSSFDWYLHQIAMLKSAYKNSLDIAQKNGIIHIAFPVISGQTFRGNQRIDTIIEMALEAIMEWHEKHPGNNLTIYFCYLDGTWTEIFQSTWKKMLNPCSP